MKKLTTLTALAVLMSTSAMAQDRTEFKVAWSIYVGWMPWGYLEDSGIMDRSTITWNPSTNTPQASLTGFRPPIWTRCPFRPEVA